MTILKMTPLVGGVVALLAAGAPLAPSDHAQDYAVAAQTGTALSR